MPINFTVTVTFGFQHFFERNTCNIFYPYNLQNFYSISFNSIFKNFTWHLTKFGYQDSVSDLCKIPFQLNIAIHIQVYASTNSQLHLYIWVVISFGMSHLYSLQSLLLCLASLYIYTVLRSCNMIIISLLSISPQSLSMISL